MVDLNHALQNRRPLVVGAVGTRNLLQETVPPEACDLVELRLDAVGSGTGVRDFVLRHRARFPILLTARHPAEGGPAEFGTQARAAAFRAFLDQAAAIDLELRSIGELDEIWSGADRRGLVRIASRHDFDNCPPLDELVAAVEAMRRAGATVAKLAFRIVEPGDLHTLAALLRLDAPVPLAVMGMGPLAPSSRLLAAQLGSVLNYGYLGDRPTAPGQWPARLLREALGHSPTLPV